MPSTARRPLVAAAVSIAVLTVAGAEAFGGLPLGGTAPRPPSAPRRASLRRLPRCPALLAAARPPPPRRWAWRGAPVEACDGEAARDVERPRREPRAERPTHTSRRRRIGGVWRRRVPRGQG